MGTPRLAAAGHGGLETETRDREARAIAAVHHAIGGALEVGTVLAAVAETVREVLGASGLSLLLHEETGGLLRVAQVAGTARDGLRPGDAVELETTGGTLKVRVLVSGDDATRGTRAGAQAWSTAAGLIVPLAAAGRALGVMLAARTPPERWTAEDARVAEAVARQISLALHNARVYTQGRRAYEELRSAQHELVQAEKMAVVGVFASGLAHDVRNPLNSLGLHLSLLERRVAALEVPAAEEMSQLAAVMRGEIQRLDAVVQEFLAFSSTNFPRRQPVVLRALLDDALVAVAAEAAAVEVRLERAGEADAVEIALDAPQITRVLANLLRNAIEAAPRGGLVRIATSAEAGRVCVRVSDTGPGLPEGVDVFHLFASTKPGRAGLGLPVAQQVVRDHGGEITVESRAGQGTTFEVWLPWRRSEQALKEEMK